MYRQELALWESRIPPRIQLKLGDSLIDLTDLNLQKGVAEKSLDLNVGQLQSAIATGTFEITVDQSIIKKPPVVVKFSTVGLSTKIAALESKCAST